MPDRIMQDPACVTLGRRLVPGAQLRVGIAVAGDSTAAWMAGIIQQLKQVSTLQIDCIAVVDSQAPSATAGSFFELYRNRIARRFQQNPERLIRISGTAPMDLRQIEQRNLDVLLWFAPLPREGDCSTLARFGVWSFAWAESGEPECSPAGFWEIYRKQNVSTLILRAHLQRFPEARTIYRYCGATCQSWAYIDNATERYRAAPVMLLRRLFDLLEDTPIFGEPAHAVVPPGLPPGNLATGQYVLQQIQRSLSLRLKNRGRRWEWFAAHRPSTGDPWNATAAPYFDIAAPPGHSYSDPFAIRWRDRSVLFLEDIAIDTGRGRLVALELADNGQCSPPVVILDKPYHLSYPCVFRNGDDMFMIPESSEDHTVQLYRATRFPYEWQLEKVLHQQVALVDTTPYYDNGVWYFFTTSIAAGTEALLFYASSLDGCWTYHPRNPICSDIRRARGAGALARHKGRLLRPAQDCSVRYGYAVAVNEVTSLSQREYTERQIGRIEPDWREGLECTHTINSDGFHEMIDGVRWTRSGQEETRSGREETRSGREEQSGG